MGKKKQPQVLIERTECKVKCSCGMKFSMLIVEVNGQQIGNAIQEAILAPHRAPGHKLSEIKKAGGGS